MGLAVPVAAIVAFGVSANAVPAAEPTARTEEAMSEDKIVTSKSENAAESSIADKGDIVNFRYSFTNTSTVKAHPYPIRFDEAIDNDGIYIEDNGNKDEGIRGIAKN